MALPLRIRRIDGGVKGFSLPVDEICDSTVGAAATYVRPITQQATWDSVAADQRAS